MIAQLAVVASEVRSLNLNLIRVFGGQGKVPPLSDFIIRPDRQTPIVVDEDNEEVERNFDNGYGAPGIEVGVDELDEKWQKVNEQAKLEWAAWLGPAVLTETGASNGQ